MTTIPIEVVAQICHEANRVLRIAFEDTGENPHWDEANDEQRASACDGVLSVLNGAGPEASHRNWLRFKAERGWVYGPVKDEEAKTHPCFLPYDELPPEQKIKDDQFVRIVETFRGMIDVGNGVVR
jgi:hypothetical protein